LNPMYDDYHEDPKHELKGCLVLGGVMLFFILFLVGVVLDVVWQ